MNKQRVAQHIKLKREIKMLEARISEAERSGEQTTDLVRGSMAEHPYTAHSITIEGCGSPELPRLYALKAWRVAECEAIEAFVDEQEDSTIRQLLTWRYLEGRTVGETADATGYSREHVSRLISSFFKNSSHNITTCH